MSQQEEGKIILFIPPSHNPPETVSFGRKSHHWVNIIFLENLEMACVNNFVQERGDPEVTIALPLPLH